MVSRTALLSRVLIAHIRFFGLLPPFTCQLIEITRIDRLQLIIIDANLYVVPCRLRGK
jgi:hypothetical protein